MHGLTAQRQRQGLTLIDKNLDHNSVEYQWSLDSYGSTFEDFKEMSLQVRSVCVFVRPDQWYGCVYK